MYQIDVATAAPALPAATPAGAAGFFTDGDLVDGTPPTIVPAEFFNMLMLEVLGVLAGAGIAPSKASRSQLLLAIQTLIETRAANWALDTGVANAYVVALSPVVTAYTNGLPVKFRVTHANAGACTLDAGAGPVPLLRNNGTPLQLGDLPLNTAVSGNYDTGAAGFLLSTTVLSQFGALAREGFGQGLEDDGAGNARVKLADSSLRRTTAGIQINEPVTYFSGALSLMAASHGGNFVSTATGTLALPATSSTWNGFAFGVSANIGAITVQPNAADSINGGVAGAVYLVPNKTSAVFLGDGAGNLVVLYQTAVPGASPAAQYLNASQSISSGRYNVDSSAGPLSLVLPASPPLGTPVELTDAFDTWGTAPVTLVPGGGNSICGAATPFVLDISGASVTIIFKSGNWSIQ